jgi:subtilisin family serine protease
MISKWTCGAAAAFLLLSLGDAAGGGGAAAMEQAAKSTAVRHIGFASRKRGGGFSRRPGMRPAPRPFVRPLSKRQPPHPRRVEGEGQGHRPPLWWSKRFSHRKAGSSLNTGDQQEGFRHGRAASIAAAGAVAVTAIAGFGGMRPPIAPRFVRSQGGQAPAAAAALVTDKRRRATEILLEVAADSSDQLKQALSDRYSGEISDLGVIELIGARLWRLKLTPGQDQGALLAQLLQDERVISAQPNYVYAPVQERRPGSPARGGAAAAKTQDSVKGGAGVKIAIIDTCIDRDHAEIKGAVQSYFDATPEAAPQCAGEDHGTAVASLIGGRDRIHGPAPAAALMEARAFTVTEEEKELAATSREVVLALNWAAGRGARVVNLSFAGPSDPLVERAAAAAYVKGIVLVAAAGNAGPGSGPLYPAAYPEVIAVTAIDAKGGLYAAANRGGHISVSERGVDVIVAQVKDAYGLETGTSFAAATVSGIVADLIAMRPKATPDEIRKALQETADSVSGKDRDELFGYGVVNANSAEKFIEANISQ